MYVKSWLYISFAVSIAFSAVFILSSVINCAAFSLLTVLDENTLKRKLDAFKNIKDNYPKYLITLDEVLPNTDYEGIKVINALEWLLEE